MKIEKYLIAVLLGFSFFGCEKDQIVDVSEIYKEKIVVRAELVKDSLFQGVKITKTLPINDTYSEDTGELVDFTGYLRINNYQIVPLHYTADGIYKPLYKLLIKGNSKYELIANGNGKQFYAQTFVPDTALVRQVYYKDGVFIEARITPNSNYAYGATWAVIGDYIIDEADDFFDIVEPIDNNIQISVQTKEIPEKYRLRSSTGMIVYTFDNEFSSYFKSKQNSQPIKNVFGQGGGPISWNVVGEDVIGIFIGYTKSDFLYPPTIR